MALHGLAYAAGEQTASLEFLHVDGTRLRYFDCGNGTPVLLLHGNGSMLEDFLSSGIIERGTPGHRFIGIDRPGFGYSERPHGRYWGPFEQARLLSQACARLGAERPIVVGHSWGALVALALALANPEAVSGLVLLSGYYYPQPRSDDITLAPPGFELVNDMVRHTVVPLMRRLMAPSTVRHVFAPCAVPERFKEAYSIPLALRPSQTRAVAEEAAILPDAAAMLSRSYRDLKVPVRLIAGTEDRIVDTEKHSRRLHRELAGSTLKCLVHCGHMVHHAAPGEVVAAIAEVSRSGRGAQVQKSSLPSEPAASVDGPMPRDLAETAMLADAPRRHWLHIGEGLVAA
jgi:pimeloyl-ACP methyl ester carboxylesterase